MLNEVVTIAVLLVGGIAGVLSRYYGGLIAYGLFGGQLPWGTLIVNLSGCFLMGLFDAAGTRRGLIGPQGRVLLLSGFCGAYTTFSSLIFELDALLRAAPLRGMIYITVSIVFGLTLFRLGGLVAGS